MSEKVRKQVLSHIGIDTFAGKVVYTLALSLYPSAINYLTRSIVGWWWIGAQLKSGTWYWEHSKKQVTYWSKIGGNAYDTSSNPYCALVYISKTSAYWNYDHCFKNQKYSSICQISVMNK